MLRGINRQIIFEDDNDRVFFLNALEKCKAISGFKLHAFCLMSNHVHLLIEQGEEPLGLVFKRIGVRYSGYYNSRYDRVGHLFQDRYKSENVESDAYFMTVLRYILRNPMKAGLEERPGTYRWSSYQAYAKGKGRLTDIELAEAVFGNREEIIRFIQEANEDSVMDDDDFDHRTKEDREKEIMIQVTKCKSVPEFQKLPVEEQRRLGLELHKKGLPIRAISRMTGLTKSTLGRVVKASQEPPETVDWTPRYNFDEVGEEYDAEADEKTGCAMNEPGEEYDAGADDELDYLMDEARIDDDSDYLMDEARIDDDPDYVMEEPWDEFDDEMDMAAVEVDPKDESIVW